MSQISTLCTDCLKILSKGLALDWPRRLNSLPMSRDSEQLLAMQATRYLATKTSHEIERLTGKPSIPMRKRKARLLRAPKYWQDWEVALLGTAPDTVIAQQIGRSVIGVKKQRIKLGLPSAIAVNAWSRMEIALLGKVPDREVARKTGRSLGAVQQMRLHLGIPNSAGLIRPWTKAEERLLGTASDSEIACKLERSVASVLSRRHHLEIPSGNTSCEAVETVGHVRASSAN